MTADTERISIVKNTSCLICDANVGVSTRNSCLIFQQNVATSDKPVAHIIGLVLDLDVQEDCIHSVVVCKKCFKLLNEVDELQERIIEIQIEIKGSYEKTIRECTMTADTERISIVKNTSCLICDASVSTRNSCPIFQQNVATSDKPVAHIIGLVLDLDVQEDCIHSVVVCKKCFKLLNEVDELQERIIEIQIEIKGSYEKTIRKYEGISTSAAEVVTNEKAMSSLSVKSVDVVKRGPGRPRLKRLNEDEMNILHVNNSAKKVSVEEKVIEQKVVSRDAALYTCLVCSVEDKFISDAKGITHHLKEIHNLRLYICDMCGQEFFKRNELSAHLEEHMCNENNEFQCEVCNRIFSNLRLYRVHKRMHYPQNKYWTCDQCGKRYLSRNKLEEHMNTHTGIRPYVCQQCGKDFALKYTLKVHERTHLDRPRPFSCSQCNKTFLTQFNLQRHERTHSAARNFICQICGKAFSTARNLEVHSVIHNGFKSFICRMCGKAFARKAEIRDHERTHTGEKPYQCEFCGAKFSQRSNLQSHKRMTHYDDKRYKCMECGKAFKRRRLLNYHTKAAHTGERPFKCSVCAATFIFPEHLKKHRRIHTGEKPYLCEVCGKAFNSRDNRNTHRFVHSDKKPFECLVCGMGFMNKRLLYNHMQTQGHSNDTIVVNKPRLINMDDEHRGLVDNASMLISHNAESMEMAFVTDSDGNTKLMPANSVELDGANQDTTMYITELKEHVILKEREDGTIEGDEIVEASEYDETVQHLIIDGQVHFANPSGIETLEEGGSEIETVTEIATLEDGTRHLVVPTSRHGHFSEQTAAIQTENGSVQLVQIRIPAGSENEGQTAWINILQQQDQ